MKYLNATDVHILKRRSEFYILIYFKANNKIKVSLEESLTMASGGGIALCDSYQNKNMT